MEITLSPDLEKLVQQRVERGEFENVEEIVEFALRRLLSPCEQMASPPSPAEKVKALKDFFDEVDRDPIDAPPLSEEALRRVNLYDDRRNRL
jgi:Arc/MetJ-type ribon-helix-helix transcriptional regulator